MPKHKVRITQVTRVEKSIIVEVEADTVEDAVEKQQGEDAPSADDPRWKIERDELENEEVEEA